MESMAQPLQRCLLAVNPPPLVQLLPLNRAATIHLPLPHNQAVATTAAALPVLRLGRPDTRLAEPCAGQGWVPNDENTTVAKRSTGVASFTRYYEHDGMLRAYANRAMFLAILFAVIALSSLAFAIYVRIQPPTVIRVDKDGNAAVVGGGARQDRTSQMAVVLSAQAAGADATTSEGV